MIFLKGEVYSQIITLQLHFPSYFFSSAVPNAFPSFSFFLFCLCFSNLWCSAEDKSPEELSTLASRLERWHIAHIFFIHFQKYLCDIFFFCMDYCTCLAEQHPSLYARQPHKDILPSVPAETSHRNILLQKRIPCSEQLWTILVAVSKSLQSSCSGNVLLYNRLGRDLKQEASKYFRVRFKSQAEPPHNTILGQSSLSESYLIFSLFLICLYVLAHQKKKKRLFFNSSCIQALSPR